ncbi:MAG: hypothetical protein CL840_02680 [Crocinitomicaceae bacterium]|nr:hypothetical protein [Crocinitomicaceae bacterium]|tara:strand:- start:11909 stop:12208 length:300 start_codon:yes stop_codon:yes gene_type:complete
MVTFEERADEFEPKIKSLSKFSIGKTGRPVEEVYKQKYSQTYSRYEVVGSSVIKNSAEAFEKYLIDRFKNIPACETKHPETELEQSNSEKYFVYLMYNE